MAAKPDADAGEAAVDLEVLRNATDGDRDLMQELAQLYMNDADLQLRAIEDAISNKDMDRLRRIGSSLWQSSESIGAHEAAALFKEMEIAARAADLATLREVARKAWPVFERVRSALADLR